MDVNTTEGEEGEKKIRNQKTRARIRNKKSTLVTHTQNTRVLRLLFASSLSLALALALLSLRSRFCRHNDVIIIALAEVAHQA